jgi:hypothetical protein
MGNSGGSGFLLHGDFDSADEALACAQGVIDQFLKEQYRPGKSAKDLNTLFLCYGEVPCIHSNEGLAFEPYQYLARRIKELTGEEPPE